MLHRQQQRQFWLHFQRMFIGKRVPYCVFHTAQFNISLLVAHRNVYLYPRPRNGTSNILNTSYFQTTVGSYNKISNNTSRLPIKCKPWLVHVNCRTIMPHIEELKLFLKYSPFIHRNFGDIVGRFYTRLKN